MPLLDGKAYLEGNDAEEMELPNQIVNTEYGDEMLEQLKQLGSQVSGSEEPDSGSEHALVRKRITNLMKQMSPEYISEFIDQGIKAGFIPPGTNPIDAI